MALVFQPPVQTHRAPGINPAESLATTGDLEFGLTVPQYNGIDITQLQAHHITDPTTHTNLAALNISGRNFNASLRVTALPVHDISWPMILPPQPIGGVWTANTQPTGRELLDKLRIISMSRAEVNKPLPEDMDIFNNKKLLNARTRYTLRVKPLPSAHEFMEHVAFHECQHVADHRWLAERIIGWWDDWLQELVTQQINVVTTRGFAGLAVSTGFGYATGVWRIIKYWCTAAAQSGNLYHTIPAGKHPVLGISEITDNSITVTVTPREILRVQPDMVNVAPHREMRFSVRDLNGNEPPLTYATAAVNPFLDAHWDKVDAQHWARRG
jgi:hypothetical protein